MLVASGIMVEPLCGGMGSEGGREELRGRSWLGGLMAGGGWEDRCGRRLGVCIVELQ